MVDVHVRSLVTLWFLQVHLFVHFKTHKIEYFSNDEGWRPIRRQQVYNESPDYDPATRQMSIADYYPKQADDLENIGSEVIKLVNPYQAFSGFSKANNVKEDFVNIPKDIQMNIQDNKNSKRYNIVVKETLPSLMENKTRKAKTILQYKSNENVIKELQDKGNKDAINKNIVEIKGILKSASKLNGSTYAVSENTEDTEDHFRTSQTSVQNTGYSYNPPTKNYLNEENLNLSASFFNLLSKYKISNTDTRNYALSRKRNVRKYFKPEFVFLPVPLAALDHRDIQHPPVNPLLSLFLSDYGYYIPGPYGPQNQFGKSYGYLASNNIHNNGPFGPYKAFSDTDSSNK